jgi:hypothetical protein
MLVMCVLQAPVVLLGSNAFVHKKMANHGILGIARKLSMRQN